MAGARRRLRNHITASAMRPPIKSVCRMKPSTAAIGPDPNMVARPAPIRPPSNRLRIRLGLVAWAAAAEAAGAATLGFTWPGCVIERWMGAAAPGAVLVDGGAVYVWEPRLPTLPPRPGRASAMEASRPRPATAATPARARGDGRSMSTSATLGAHSDGPLVRRTEAHLYVGYTDRQRKGTGADRRHALKYSPPELHWRIHRYRTRFRHDFSYACGSLRLHSSRAGPDAARPR